MPSLLNDVLEKENELRDIASKIYNAKDVLYIGRGMGHGLALEGALKLKEISYIHAEGYAAGELKHGPIALIDENVPVIGIIPTNNLFEKTYSNLAEVKARGGKIICITDEKGKKNLEDLSDLIFSIKNCNDYLQPIVSALPVQLLAYHVACFKGTDVDQPRNLKNLLRRIDLTNNKDMQIIIQKGECFYKFENFKFFIFFHYFF